MLASIDSGALLDSVIAGLVAGIVVTLVFSIAIYGAARFSELGREGRTAVALLYGAVTVAAGIAFMGVIVVGIIVMTAK